MLARDRTEDPDPSTYSICYVNAFQAQPDSLDWWQAAHPGLLLRDAGGALVIDRDWGEALLDISTDTSRTELMTVLGPWVEGCATSGFRAVEPDNLDSWTRSGGLLTDEDALAMAALLIDRAHESGQAIAQKNAAELTSRARAAGFDFAVAEECQVHDECEVYSDAYGSALLEVEYTDQPGSAFEDACRTRGTSRRCPCATATSHPSGWKGTSRSGVPDSTRAAGNGVPSGVSGPEHRLLRDRHHDRSWCEVDAGHHAAHRSAGELDGRDVEREQAGGLLDDGSLVVGEARGRP